MTSWNVSEVSGVNLSQFGGFGRLVALVADYFEKRRTVAMMQDLDARMLADIGVERYEIESLVYGKRAESGEGWSFKSMLGAIVRRMQRAQAIRALNELPDHMLADIGVERAMIGDVVDQHFRAAQAKKGTIAATLDGRRAAALDRPHPTLSRIDPALLADAGYKHGRMGWQPKGEADTANANKKGEVAA